MTLSLVDQKNHFFGLYWYLFKFDNLRRALGTALKLYIIVAKGLKLKDRKIWELIPTFVEITGVTREKLVGKGERGRWDLPSPYPG